MSARVVVTGGAGFIGSHLVESLALDGYRVDVIDDLSGGRADDVPTDLPGVRLLVMELGSPAAESSVEESVAGADMVFHLASPIGVGRAHSNPSGTADAITTSTAQVVRACRRHGTKLLFTSSSEIYGAVTQRRPLREGDMQPFNASARWSYGRAKAQGEIAVGRLVTHGIDSWIVRLFNVVARRQRANTGLVVAAMCSAALNGGPIVVHDDGTAVRSFLHVADAVVALRLIASSASLMGQPVNLGGSETLSMADLAQLIALRAPCPVDVLSTPSTEVFGSDYSAVHHRTPDLTRFHGAVDFWATLSLEDAVDDWFRSAVREPSAVL